MIYIIVKEANFKTKNLKGLIKQGLFFFPNEHVHTLISKEIKHITHFPMLKAHPHYHYQCNFAS